MLEGPPAQLRLEFASWRSRSIGNEGGTTSSSTGPAKKAASVTFLIWRAEALAEAARGVIPPLGR